MILTDSPEGDCRSIYSPSHKPREPPPEDVEGLLATYRDVIAEWQKSDCRKRLLGYIDSQRPESGWAIRKAVCFALGTSTLYTEAGIGRERTYTFLPQLAFFLDIVQHRKSIDLSTSNASANALV